MAREALKELIKASHQCTDKEIGKQLPYYEKRGLDKKERDDSKEEQRFLFRKHLTECLHCMALYNIETKYKHGYVDTKRTLARRIKAMLLKLRPSRRQALATVSVWIVTISLTLLQQDYLRPQEIIKAFDSLKSNDSLVGFLQRPKNPPSTPVGGKDRSPLEARLNRSDKSAPNSPRKEAVVNPINRPEPVTEQGEQSYDFAAMRAQLAEMQTQLAQATRELDHSVNSQMTTTIPCTPLHCDQVKRPAFPKFKSFVDYDLKLAHNSAPPPSAPKEIPERADSTKPDDAMTEFATNQYENKMEQRQASESREKPGT